MRSARAAAFVLSVAGIGSLHAQTAAATPAQPADLDPARLAAAREPLGVMLPAEQRDPIMESMIRPMMANLRQSMLQAPGFGEMLGKDPNVSAAFDRFVKGQEDRSVATVKAGMPGMIEAMARAYARRFDTRQIADIRAFFETPSGKAYISASYSIMSDPDVQAWQRDLVSRFMAHMQEDIAKFVSDVSASHPPEQK
jgi:hypothetical protein